MRLSILCLLVAVVVMNVMVEESSAWPRFRRRWRLVRRAWDWSRRVRLSGKRGLTDQDPGNDGDCDFTCFLALASELSEEDVKEIRERFDNLDTNNDGVLSQEELAAASTGDDGTGDQGDQGGQGGQGGQAGDAQKRELLDDLAELKALLKDQKERK